MELTNRILYIVVSVSVLLFAGATYEEIIGDKHKQGEYIQKQLDLYKTKFSAKNTDAAKIKRTIDSTEASLNDLNNFLKNYQNETYLSPDKIAAETNTVIYLTAEVEKIQESFRKKVINLYKHGKYYDLELLFSSRSPNEYLRRNQYLQHFSQNRKKELRELQSKKFILEEKKKMLTLSISSQRFYVEAKREQKTKLEFKLKDLQVLKESIDNEANINTERIARYETQLNNINSFIENFTEKKDSFAGSKLSRINYDSGDLTKSKGVINNPIDVGLIIKGFGGYSNGATGAISINNGYDFSVSYGSKVYAVAGGIVTIVGELPYYGKCIIIKHDSGYRTLYACLSETGVSTGDIVKLNQIIGKSGETLEGQMLHFEIWKDVTPLNPGEWLRK
jgi:murein hydrolase activator